MHEEIFEEDKGSDNDSLNHWKNVNPNILEENYKRYEIKAIQKERKSRTKRKKQNMTEVKMKKEALPNFNHITSKVQI